MPTLKEIKGRIGSVKSTLKITSAMKLVSSAKLRKAQVAIEAMRPYEEALQGILATLEIPGQAGNDVWGAVNAVRDGWDSEEFVMPDSDRASRPTALVAMASNSSLCGGFNANIIAKVRSERKPGDVIFSLGRKMADAMRRDGYPTPEDLNDLVEHPAYGPAAALVEKLAHEVEDGKYSRVLLVYTHFVSTARQVPVAEELLADPRAQAEGNYFSQDFAKNQFPSAKENQAQAEEILIEPGKKELLASLRPKTLKLKLYAALLDSVAAEHAARTVAMQTATDNAENLLSELTLQYNKGRQQKITSEILDLAGGQTE
jgi:F-type H+-transporting ATPase subunit gamma